MKTYLLVHGAWQGSGCWRKVSSRLQAAGHSVITPDIPWSDANVKSERAGLTGCIDHLINNLGNDDTIIVAGHSIGGIIISQLAEEIPENIIALVYISGFLLKNGQCANDTQALMTDSHVSRNMTLSADKNNIVLSKSILREAMYEDVNDEDYSYAVDTYSDQPLWTFRKPVSVTEERFGSVPKYYIECLKDKAIPINVQKLMQQNWECYKKYSLNCSHSPFYSMPEELVDILLKI